MDPDYDDDSNNDENDEEDQIFDDSDIDEDAEDALMTEGVDNSAKEQIKEDEKKDENDSDTEEVIIEVEKKEKPKFVSGITKIHFNEYSKILSKLATAISESTVLVPERYESLLKCESGNVITIAENWIKHRNVVPLPQELYRGYAGYTSEHLDLSKLKTMDELCFRDPDGDDDYFDTCFRKDGYHINYGR